MQKPRSGVIIAGQGAKKVVSNRYRGMFNGSVVFNVCAGQGYTYHDMVTLVTLFAS